MCLQLPGSWEGRIRPGYSHLLSLQPWGNEQRGGCSTCECCFPFSSTALNASGTYITSLFASQKVLKEETPPMSPAQGITLACHCPHVPVFCRDPGQAVSPGMGRPHSGDPLWSHTCCLKERRWQAAAKSRLCPISKAFPSLSETLEVAGNDGGAQAGSEVPAKGSAGSGQGPGYFSMNDIVISCGFPSRCVCCK